MASSSEFVDNILTSTRDSPWPDMLFVRLLFILSITSCAIDPVIDERPQKQAIVCDTYIILSMCVQDLVGDGTVDMVYFTDTNEIFMYRDGMKEEVGQVMPFHQCAVPLSKGMQETTNRILDRNNMTFNEELSITRALISNYLAAKPTIDACNASFAGKEPGEVVEHEFFGGDDDWDS